MLQLLLDRVEILYKKCLRLLILLQSTLMQILNCLDTLLDLTTHGVHKPLEPIFLPGHSQLVLYDFLIHLIIEHTVVDKDLLHPLELPDHKIILFDQVLDRNAPSQKPLIDRYHVVQLLIVSHLLELAQLIR